MLSNHLSLRLQSLYSSLAWFRDCCFHRPPLLLPPQPGTINSVRQTSIRDALTPILRSGVRRDGPMQRKKSCKNKCGQETSAACERRRSLACLGLAGPYQFAEL